MMKVNRSTYAKLIEEDIEWLMKQPRTLEREHIKLIIEHSIYYAYPDDELSVAFF